MLAGAYWVLYPGSPATRADAFIARLDAACPGWRNVPFILQADCEEWNSNPGTVPSKAEIGAFCGRLIERMPKLQPIVYAPKWVYGDSLKGLGAPLWASAYVTGSSGFKALYPGDSSSRWAAYSGQVPAILQYTSSATIGGQSTCDANAYRGTLAELTALLAPGWSDDVTPQDLLSAQIVVGGTSYGTMNGVLATLMQRTNAVTNQQMPALAETVGSLPTAAETATAVLTALGTGDLNAAATAVKAALGDVRAAQLGALLQA